MEIYSSIAQSVGTDASTVKMALSVGIFALAYLLIAFDLVEKVIAVLAGVLAVFLLRLITFEQAVRSVDLNVIFLLVGMMANVAVLAETGFFEWVAVFIAKKMKGNAVLILAGLLLATMVFSAFLDNVTCVILMAPLTIMITQLLEVPTVPFLIYEALASNIGGTATLIGDPPNIIIGSSAGLSFNDFLLNLTPVIAVVGLLFLFTVVLVMGRSLKIPAHVRTRVVNAYPALAITDPKTMKMSLAVFALIFMGFFFQRQIHLEVGITALCGMGLMFLLCRSSSDKMLKHVEWDAMFFFIGLFILVGAMNVNGAISLVANEMASLCGSNLMAACMIILWGSAFLSAVLDNIPFVIAMTPMVHELVGKTGGDPNSPHPLYWALALGACLGGNGTLIGASANVMSAKIGERNGCPVTFKTFFIYGFPLMIESVVVCSIYIFFRYR